MSSYTVRPTATRHKTGRSHASSRELSVCCRNDRRSQHSARAAPPALPPPPPDIYFKDQVCHCLLITEVIQAND